MVQPKTIIRKTVIIGSNGAYPEEGSQCKVKVLDLTLNEQSPKSNWIQGEGVYSVIIGEASCVFDISFEYALTCMNKGEKSVLELRFNDHTCQITAELLEFTQGVPFFSLNTSERLELAIRHKAVGVDLFKNSLVKEAFHRFSKSIKYIISLRGTETYSEEVNSLYYSVCNNIALCQLQFHNYEHAIALCDKVISSYPINVKALFRRAEARTKLKVFDRAADDLKKVISLEPQNKLARKKLEFVEKELNKQEENYVNMVKRMCPFH
nr:PREDICTED: peptidyl-prolyl cis-trans isomerase FKBP62-like [Bemisia tabaci]